jgi:TPR repeat protein
MYLQGRGVTQDYSAAMKWYRMAADQGFADAQFSLGEMYRKGLCGLPQSDDLAVEWYRKAADQKHFDAQQALESIYDYDSQ